MRKITSLLLIFTLMMTQFNFAFALEGDFANHWAKEEIEYLITKGYIQGDEEGNLNLDNGLSRAEYATVICNIMKLAEIADLSGYTDVSVSDWYYDSMAKMVAKGYIYGNSETTLNPNGKITREEVFVILARILNLETSATDIEALNQFEDSAEISDWARDSIASLVGNGYLQGDDGKIKPSQNSTRAESFVVLHRTEDMLIEKGSLSVDEVLADIVPGLYADGVYIGEATGYGGTMKVEVTIEDGRITSITMISEKDDSPYITVAKRLMGIVVTQQNTEVDTISGATYSSKGVIASIEDALSQAAGITDEPGESEASIASASNKKSGSSGSSAKTSTVDGNTYDNITDGYYEGSGLGYKAYTTVGITVENGEIVSIDILSWGDDTSYFKKALGVIEEVIKTQSTDFTPTDVDGVSGATRSARGILGAIEDALENAIENEEELVVVSLTEVIVDSEENTITIGNTVYEYSTEASGEMNVEIGSGTGIYYGLSEGDELEGMLYGRASMTYADYYYDVIGSELTGSATEVSRTDLANPQSNPSDSIIEDGLYDEASGGTSYVNIPLVIKATEDASTGINNVEIVVDSKLFVEGLILNEVTTNGTDPLGAAVSNIELYAPLTQPLYGNDAKQLLDDGTYKTFEGDLEDGKYDDIDLSEVSTNPEVGYSDGSYELNFNFGEFDVDVIDYFDSIQAITIENENGIVSGALYNEDITIAKTDGDLNLIIQNGDVMLNTGEVAYTVSRFNDFYSGDDLVTGKYTVVIKALGYDDVEVAFDVANRLTDEEIIVVEDSDWIYGKTSINVDTTALPTDFEYETIIVEKLAGEASIVLEENVDYVYSGGILTINDTDDTNPNMYTITLIDYDYQSVSDSFSLYANTVQNMATMTDGQIYMDSISDLDVYDYAAQVSSVTITPGTDGEETSTYVRVGKRSTQIIDENGAVDGSAETNKHGEVFVPGVEYTLEVTADGVKDMFIFNYTRPLETTEILDGIYTYSGVSFDGASEIGDTGVFYKFESGVVPEGILYGTTAMTYAEYYYAETTYEVNANADQGLLSDNPSDAIATDELFDAISSATSLSGSHASHYPTILNYTESTVVDEPFTIDGLDIVDVSIDADLYVQAMILDSIITTDSGKYAISNSVSNIAINENPEAPIYNNNVKALRYDGSYGKGQVVAAEGSESVIDLSSINALSTVVYSSSYGNYEFEIDFEGFQADDETADLYYTDYLMNFYSLTIEDEDGQVAGTVYYEDTWEETSHKYWLDIAITKGDFTAKGYDFNSERQNMFFDGDDLKAGTYSVTMKSRGYDDIKVTDYVVGKRLAEDEGITFTTDAALTFVDGEIKLSASENLPNDFEADEITIDGLVEGEDFTYNSGTLILNDTVNIVPGSYTITLFDPDFEPVSADFTLMSDMTQEQIDYDITTGILTIDPSANVDMADYISQLSTVYVYSGVEKTTAGGIVIADETSEINQSRYSVFSDEGLINHQVSGRGTIYFNENVIQIVLEANGYELFLFDYQYPSN